MIKTIETINAVWEIPATYSDEVMIVHSGVFHAHDVFACANADLVIRTRNPEVIKEALERYPDALVVDVGLGALDHHNWKGYRGLGTMFPESIFKVEREREYFDILESIAKIDSGEEAIDYVSSMISSFNPCWNESSAPEDYDKKFELAIEFARTVLSNPAIFIALKERELAREAGKAEAASIVDQAMFDSAGNSLLVLPRFVPWQEKVFHYNELAHIDGKFSFLWVLFPAPDGTYRVQAVPKTADSMEFHAPVQARPDDKGFIFVHPNKFICGYQTKDDAIKAVRGW